MDALDRRRQRSPSDSDDEQNIPLAQRRRLHAPEPPPPLPVEQHEPFVLRDDSYQQSQRLVSMWRDGRLCDVEVLVDGRRFACHRVVLAAGSDMLAAAFSPEWVASQSNELQLHDLPAAGFERALEFLYTGACPIGEATLTPLLDAASRLQIFPLLRLGETFLHERLEPGNCFDAWCLAENLQLTNLLEAARSMCYSDFERACTATGFLQIDEARLRSLLTTDGLVAAEEVRGATRTLHTAFFYSPLTLT